jgi:hypothetical protein
MKPSARYKRDAELLAEFRDAYVDLINNTRPERDIFLPRLVPAIPLEQWEARRQRLASAAGAAAGAYARYGGTFTLRNAAYIMNGVQPVANWELSLRDPQQMGPDVVVSAVEGAHASALEEHALAAEREKGLTGLVAAFLRWPENLREAVGPGNAARKRAAGALGIVAQIIVGALAAALGAAVLAGVVALWHVVT